MKTVVAVSSLLAMAFAAYLAKPTDDDTTTPVVLVPQPPKAVSSLPREDSDSTSRLFSSASTPAPDVASMRATAMHPGSRGPAIVIDASPKARPNKSPNEEPPPS